MKVYQITAFNTWDEPGDSTRYEFTITVGYSKNYVLISKGSSGAVFVSYDYNIDHLEMLADYNPDFTKDIPPKEYQGTFGKSEIGKDFISYMCEHSKCNPWTAIAAIRAALKVIPMLREIGEVE